AVGAALVSLSLLASGPAAAGKVYHCSGKEIFGLDQEPVFKKNPNVVSLLYWSNMFIDIDAGTLRFGNTPPVKLFVVTTGDPHHDFVAGFLDEFAPGIARTLEGAITGGAIIRLRDLTGEQPLKPPTLIAQGPFEVVVGPCEVVQ